MYKLMSGSSSIIESLSYARSLMSSFEITDEFMKEAYNTSATEAIYAVYAAHYLFDEVENKMRTLS